MERIKRFCFNKKKIRLLKAVCFLFLMVSMMLPIVAHAEDGDDTSAGYRSWIRGAQGYSNWHNEKTELNGKDQVTEEYDDKPDTIEKLLAKLVASLGTAINTGLKGKNSTSGRVDASIGGIVMGKITNNVSYFVFDLTDKNIYGSIGATIYVLLRAFSFAILFITTLINIIKTMYVGEGKGLSRLKDSLLTSVLVMILLFMMPQIVDWLCEARDVVSVTMYEGLSEVGGTAVTADDKDSLSDVLNLEKEYYKVYDETPNFLNALVYFMVCCVPFVFIVNYLKIAVQQTVLFGMFPVFAMLAPKDKKSLSDWMAVVFSNIFVPAIDITLLMLPMLIIKAISISTERMTGGILKAIIVVVIFMGIIPCRNQILQMLGNKFGVQGGLGLLGAGLLAAKAVQGAAAFAGRGLRGNADKESDTASDDGKAADETLRDHDRAQALEAIPASSAQGAAEGSGDSDHEAASAAAAAEATGEAPGQVINEGDVNEGAAMNSGFMPDVPEDDHAQASEVAAAEATGGASSESVEGESASVGDTTGATTTDTAPEDAAAASGAAEVLSVPGMEEVAAATVAAEALQGGMQQVIDERAGAINNGGAKEDTAGREFNLERAANLQSIDNMKETSRQLDAESLAHKASVQNAKGEILKNDARIRENEARLKQMADKTPLGATNQEKVALQQKVNDLKAQNINYRDAIDKSNLKIEQNQMKQQTLKAEISRRQDIERSMAQASGRAGRGDRVYNSANEMKRELQHETKVRSISNYRNFDKNSTAFSQAEKAQFQRTKDVREAELRTLRLAVGGAAMTAGLAATGLATLASATAGERGMSAVASQGIGMTTDPRMYEAASSAPKAIAGAVKDAGVTAMDAKQAAANRYRAYTKREADRVAKKTLSTPDRSGLL